MKYNQLCFDCVFFPHCPGIDSRRNVCKRYEKKAQGVTGKINKTLSGFRWLKSGLLK